MKFLCLICAETVMEQMTEADAEQHYQEYAEFTETIRRSGHLVECNRLLPPRAATTVRVRKGKISTTDGPFVETKEQLGGLRDRGQGSRRSDSGGCQDSGCSARLR